MGMESPTHTLWLALITPVRGHLPPAGICSAMAPGPARSP